MAKKTILKAGIKKVTKKKPQPRYVKTPSGMKLNPERFKQKPLPKTSKLKQTKAAKKPGFKTGVAAGVAGTVGATQLQDVRARAKKRSDKVKKAAQDTYEKQKQKQKEYRQKKGGKGNR